MVGKLGSSGRRGPPPKPTALRVLNGSTDKRAANDREPIAPSDRPERPPDLEGQAAIAWDDITIALETMGILSSADLHALHTLCTSWALYVEAVDACKQYGAAIVEPVQDADGKKIGHTIKRNPYYTIRREMVGVLTRLLGEFGLTPSSRTRVRVDMGQDTNDPFAQLLTDDCA